MTDHAKVAVVEGHTFEPPQLLVYSERLPQHSLGLIEGTARVVDHGKVAAIGGYAFESSELLVDLERFLSILSPSSRSPCV